MANSKRKSIPSRLATVEKKLKQTAPEIKYDYGVLQSASLPNASLINATVTDIPQGVSSKQRIGLDCYITQIDISGYASPGVDLYLINPAADATPLPSAFSSIYTGAFYMHDHGKTLWHRISFEGDNSGNFKFTYRFKFPLKMHYETSLATSAPRNRIRLVALNNVGFSVPVALNYRIHFYDP